MSASLNSYKSKSPLQLSVVMITAPDLSCADSLATFLVQQKLAACVNIIPGVTSVYAWEGEIHRDQELLLIVKTCKENLDELVLAVKSRHPYSVPEIVALSSSEGADDYFSWVESVCKKERQTAD